MNHFPLVDPIPLPAPVWMFKSLHVLTLALHFVAVMILLGGLLIATVLNLLGGSSRIAMHASGALARRMPVVMTYVINLGIPPLLFAQVLYGTSLYTSSVLIGAYWFAVIPLLMSCYWTLYQFSERAGEGRQAAWMGLLAWVLAGCISRILSTNMTLMLQPDVWQEMYSATAAGVRLPPFDPALLPRWLFMLSGGFTVAGLWMVWVAGRKTVQAPLNAYLAGLGGRVSAAAVLIQTALYHSILKGQPTAVMSGIDGNPWLHIMAKGWYGIAAAIFVFAVFAAVKKPCRYAAGYVAALLALLMVAFWAVVRDSIRDLTLLSKGFDVWQQHVAANWSVIIAFFIVFGLGVAALAWLISVMMRAKPVPEGGV